MLQSIAGRSVVVTGASKGIGKGIARIFARHGARVLVVSRTLTEARAAAQEIGGETQAFAADVSDWSACQAMAAAAVSAFGGIDILCANAGIYPQAHIEQMDPGEWDTVLGTNLKGSFLSLKACLPWLKQSTQGRVILTSSITGPVTGFPGWSHYAASKAGQLGFMRTAAIELAPRRITVNAVLPGNIATEGLAELGHDYKHMMEQAIPLRRLGEVDDIGNACLFFATDEAAYVTGQALAVDGGQVLPESISALEAM